VCLLNYFKSLFKQFRCVHLWRLTYISSYDTRNKKYKWLYCCDKCGKKEYDKKWGMISHQYYWSSDIKKVNKRINKNRKDKQEK
jgi:hypothetical protein